MRRWFDRHAISSPDAPPAIGPYSQGIRTGSFVFLSGQIPLVRDTGKFPPGPRFPKSTTIREDIIPSEYNIDSKLQVKIDPNANVRMRVLRGSVSRVLPADKKDAKDGV